VQRQTPKKVVVSKAAITAWDARSTKASAKLEGREVPADHTRSAALAAYLAGQERPER
jgi:hypothetical protein